MPKFAVRRLPIYPKQAEFRQSAAWIRGFCAGRGSGKTKIGAIDLLLKAENRQPFMVVSPSYKVMEDTTLPALLETADMLGVRQRFYRSPSTRLIFRTQDGGTAEAVFRSGEDPESLRGPSKAGIWLDEASIMHQDVYKLSIPALRYEGRMGWLTMTFTPKGRRHWTFGTFYDEIRNESGTVDRVARPNTHLVTASTKENPFAPPEFYDLIAQEYTTALAAQELEGHFVDLSGLMFSRGWFPTVDAEPTDAARVRYWDKAATEDGGAFTVGLRMSRTPFGLFTVEDVVRGQWSAFERDRIMLETARSDAERFGKTNVLIYFEQEGGSGGKESAQATVRMLGAEGFPVFADRVSGGAQKRVKDNQRVPGRAKILRATPYAAQCEAGNVRLLRAPWNDEYVEELTAFPEYTYADQVDASSGAFNKLTNATALNYAGPAQTANPEPIDPQRHGVRIERSIRGGGYRPNRRR